MLDLFTKKKETKSSEIFFVQAEQKEPWQVVQWKFCCCFFFQYFSWEKLVDHKKTRENNTKFSSNFVHVGVLKQSIYTSKT